MSTQRQDRRGTETEHDTFTGAVGEITVDTTNDEVRVHDGARTGGFALPNFSSQQKRLYSYDASPGGTATVITCATQADAVALTAGLNVTLKMASTATGAATLQWGGLAAEDVKKYSGGAKVDVEADDWVANQELSFWFDGVDWVVQLGGGGGGAEFVDNITASGVSSVKLTDVFEDGFNYQIDLNDFDASNSGAQFFLRFTTAGGTSITSGYDYALSQRSASIDNTITSGSASSGLLVGAMGTGASDVYSANIEVMNPSNAVFSTHALIKSAANAGGGEIRTLQGSTSLDAATSVKGIEIFVGSGTFSGSMTAHRRKIS